MKYSLDGRKYHIERAKILTMLLHAVRSICLSYQNQFLSPNAPESNAENTKLMEEFKKEVFVEVGGSYVSVVEERFAACRQHRRYPLSSFFLFSVSLSWLEWD